MESSSTSYAKLPENTPAMDNGNSTETTPSATPSMVALQPTLAIDNSNYTSKQTSTKVAVSTTEAAN
jgi:hypothetical protein